MTNEIRQSGEPINNIPIDVMNETLYGNLLALRSSGLVRGIMRDCQGTSYFFEVDLTRAGWDRVRREKHPSVAMHTGIRHG